MDQRWLTNLPAVVRYIILERTVSAPLLGTLTVKRRADHWPWLKHKLKHKLQVAAGAGKVFAADKYSDHALENMASDHNQEEWIVFCLEVALQNAASPPCQDSKTPYRENVPLSSPTSPTMRRLLAKQKWTGYYDW